MPQRTCLICLVPMPGQQRTLLTNTIRNSLGQKHPDFAHLWVMRLNVCFLNYTCKKKPTIVNVKISGLTCDFRCNPTTLPHN